MSIKPFILSTGGMTTKRIVVPIENINFDAFDKNPIMLFNHQRGLVIGKWANRRIEEGKLLADPVFDDEDPESKKISGKVERGFIKAASIGIRNIVAEEREDQDGAYIYVLSCELREASVVDIPSDAEALVFYDANDKEIDLKEADFSDIFQTKKFVKQMDKKKIAQTLGLSDDASDEIVLGAISKAFEDSKKLKDLQVETKTKQKQKAVELVDAAVSAGKLQKEVKDDFLNLADANFELFEKTIIGLPEPVRLTQVVKSVTSASLSDQEGRKDWTFTDWQKKDSAGLAKLSEDDYKKLYSAEFGD